MPLIEMKEFLYFYDFPNIHLLTSKACLSQNSFLIFIQHVLFVHSTHVNLIKKVTLMWEFLCSVYNRYFLPVSDSSSLHCGSFRQALTQNNSVSIFHDAKTCAMSTVNLNKHLFFFLWNK
jgi:hypothetical protein